MIRMWRWYVRRHQTKAHWTRLRVLEDRWEQMREMMNAQHPDE